MLHILRKISERLSFRPSKKIAIFIVAIFFLIFGFFYYFFIIPPANFPLNSVYVIEENETLSEITLKSKKQNLIKSTLFFKIISILFSGNKGIISGDYVLNERENVFKIAKRFSGGDYRLSAVKITVPEGSSIFEIAEILSKKNDLKKFNSQEFIKLAKDKEGYLYPDTYFFLPNAKMEHIIKTMENNFMKKISSIETEIKTFGKTFREILVMASIIEKEVSKTEDRKIVAGILWKRISIGMPLQVDAVFPYITQKKGGIITREDLKIDSSYNTYLNKGLPPGPISNPSLDAIVSTINPTETKYLFYISDKKGITRFAKTLEEHNINIDKYLR